MKKDPKFYGTLAKIKAKLYKAQGIVANLYSEDDDWVLEWRSADDTYFCIAINEKDDDGYYYVRKGPKVLVDIWFNKSTFSHCVGHLVTHIKQGEK